jgi:hypothetical protein
VTGHTLQDVFECGLDAFCRGRELHPREWRAASSIRYCYTQAMGSHVQACMAGDYSKQFFHACRHRSCPRCADSARAAWIDAQLQRLLPCPHFHVVFTWPHSLLALWEHNRSWCTKLLFDCARSSLLQLLADPRHLGAMPGLLMSLHTWGRTLSHHPHLHCLLSAGGLTHEQQWKATKPGWLVPLQPLKKLFRGKLLHALWDALAHDRLLMPAWSTTQSWQLQIKRLYRKHWNLEIRPPYDSGRGVALYLARYAKGGPLPANRPLRQHCDHVYFDYTDHRDGRSKTLKLQTAEFISRVLWHAPPRGVHTTRHAGLYSSSHLELNQAARKAMDTQPPLPTWPRPSAPTPAPRPPQRCPKCLGPLLRLACSRRRLPGPPSLHQRGEISLSRALSATREGHSPAPPPATTVTRGPTCRSNGHAAACHPGLAAGRSAHCPPPGQGGMPQRAA